MLSQLLGAKLSVLVSGLILLSISLVNRRIKETDSDAKENCPAII